MRKFYRAIAIIVLICLLLGLIDLGVRAEIASRFKIESSWDAIRKHLFYQEFKPGISRDEVHKILDKVGNWKVTYEDFQSKGAWDSDTNQRTFMEIIRFENIFTDASLRDWYFLYDKNDRLITQSPNNS